MTEVKTGYITTRQMEMVARAGRELVALEDLDCLLVLSLDAPTVFAVLVGLRLAEKHPAFADSGAVGDLGRAVIRELDCWLARYGPGTVELLGAI